MKLSHSVSVLQAHRHPRLILNMLEKPDVGAPSVSYTTGREVAPEWLQFGMASPCILQTVWEAELDQGLVRVSKLKVTDTYHRGTVAPSQVGAFAYVAPLIPGDKDCIICIDLVLPMGWVERPKFFCAFLEILTDVANNLVDTELLVLSYGAIYDIPSPPPPLKHTPLRASPISIIIT